MTSSSIFIGMDLGTHKTSVACSNGRRDVMQSAVGWPKDHIARSMLGSDVVFGHDIELHRLALDVCRPFRKGAFKYSDPTQIGLAEDQFEMHEEAARLLVAHAVSRINPQPGIPIYGIVGAPSRASVQNKRALMAACEGTFDGVMVVPEPFTVAYGMNRLSETLVADIGAGTIDICPMYGSYPKEEDQFTIAVGGDLIDESICEHLRKSFPGIKLSENMARMIKEKHGFVHDVNEQAVVTLRIGGQPQAFDVTDALKAACSTIVPPIVEGLKEVISRLDPEYQPRMLQNILLGGGGSQLKGLDKRIEDGLAEYGDVNVTRVYDSVFAGSVGALRLAMAMPQENWNQIEKASPARDAA